MIAIIGLIHLFHSPLLVIFPFIFQTFTTDILYINYFFFIMFLYTFINGECPISYVCKLIMDKKYIAGSHITYYPEMECLLSKRSIVYYFGTTTLLYYNITYYYNSHKYILLFSLYPFNFVKLLLLYSQECKYFFSSRDDKIHTIFLLFVYLTFYFGEPLEKVSNLPC